MTYHKDTVLPPAPMRAPPMSTDDRKFIKQQIVACLGRWHDGFSIKHRCFTHINTRKHA